MPTDESGDKWACEPCIRGHRSTRCEHYDRFMLRVKKPGRPLSSCPHPKNQCTCGKERVMMVRIPKASSCICAPAYTLGLDGLPLVPSQGTPPPGLYNPSPAYLFQAPAPNGYYRIQKPSQRCGSFVDAQAVARAFHAEQWADQPIYESQDPQQQFAPAGVRVSPYTDGFQHQLQYHNANGVPNSGLSLQNDVSLSRQGLVSNSHAEHSLHHENSAATLGNELVITGRQEESRDISNGHGLKDNKSRVAFLEQSPLSLTPGAPNGSLNDPDSKSHKICCQGKPRVQTAQSEDSKAVALDSNGLPENTITGRLAADSRYIVSVQDEALNGTNKVSDHANNHGNKPLLDHHQPHSNEQRTSYTIPSTSVTASPPLDPAQSSFSHQHPHLYSQKVLQYVPYGSNGSAAPLTEGNVDFTPAHNCNCGDACDCLGCAAHPYNATTRNHVQSLGDLLAYGDNDQQPGSRPQSPRGSSFAQSTEAHSTVPGINPRLVENVPSPPVSSHHRPSVLSLTDNDVTSSAEPFNEAHPPLFSSSGYYTMEFPMESLGSCTDVSGSCQCGDDCACIGCLTHTGHNGIPLDLDSAVVPASPNGVEARRDLNEDDERDASDPKKCCT